MSVEIGIPLKTFGGVVLLFGVVLRYLLLWVKNHSSSLPLPPGPKALPIIGNAHQLPDEHQEKEFLSWGRKFGDLVYARLFGRSMLVLNSADVARDLMERRGAIYSDRPRFVLIVEMLDLYSNVPLLPYGDRFRKMRKWIQDSFSTAALVVYRPRQRRETDVLLKGILARPDAIASHIARFTEALIMDIAYGHTVNSDDDKYIEIGQNGNHAFATIGSAGSMLVDFFPILKYYPTWLPGAAFKRRATRALPIVRKMHDAPYNMVKSQFKYGNVRPSFTANLLQNHFFNGQFTLTPEEERDIKGAAGTLYAAGTETMASTMHTFILAMLLHPDVYRKAQEEMDRVVGPMRLPDVDDRESLPYLNCIIKEVYRWHAPLPLGLPHYSTQEDEYRGFRIPKKTVVVGNIWGMSRDENVYPNPEAFRPERFMDKTEKDILDPRSIVFGFGRRLCPGKEFADTCVFLVLANIVATMKINEAKDRFGADITPSLEFTSGFASRPKDFECNLTPRSERTIDLIRQQDTGT